MQERRTDGEGGLPGREEELSRRKGGREGGRVVREGGRPAREKRRREINPSEANIPHPSSTVGGGEGCSEERWRGKSERTEGVEEGGEESRQRGWRETNDKVGNRKDRGGSRERIGLGVMRRTRKIQGVRDN